MGKNSDPTPEELEFIFECFEDKKLSDKETIEEMDTTGLPRRSVRFIAGLRREFNAAKKVLLDKLQKEVDPVTIKRRLEHFDYLTAITEELLEQNLDKVVKTKPGSQAEYIIYDGSYDSPEYPATKAQLEGTIQMNVENTIHKHSEWDFYNCFIPHFGAEISIEGISGFQAIVNSNPYLVIDTLRVMRMRKTFKGECPICKELMGK